MRRALLGVVLYLLLSATRADAALDFQPCAEPAGVQCATIDVPVDRSGRGPGTFTLLVHRIPPAHPPTPPRPCTASPPRPPRTGRRSSSSRAGPARRAPTSPLLPSSASAGRSTTAT